MDSQDRRLVGEDIKTVEFGWPVGMPTCRPMGDGLHEVRTHLPGNRIVRVFFYIDRKQRMVLLHGLVKKSQATPASDLDLARQNMRKHEKGLK
jgi:phage-related protein